MSLPGTPGGSGNGAAPAGRGWQPRVVLGALFCAYLLSIMDRVVFGIVLKPVKAAFHLSDSQLGLLSGAAFALSYAIFSPFGGWVIDRSPRKLVLAGAVGFWSLATLLTGLAGSYLALAVARVGVALGESLLHPVAVALIAGTTPRDRRAGSASFYISAGAVGSILALLFGGLILQRLTAAGQETFPWIGSVAPWRAMFIWAFVPGLLLVVAILSWVREPAAEPPEAGGQVGAGAFMANNRGFCTALFGGMAVLQMGSYAGLVWNVVYFQRVFGWSAAGTSQTLALSVGLAVLAGALLIGRLLTSLRRRGVADGPLLVAAASGPFYCVVASLGYLSGDGAAAVALLAVASLAGYAPTVCAFAMMAESLPPPIRAQIAGILTCATGILSSSVGPLLVGSLDDRLFPGEAGIRYSLVVTVILSGLLGSALAIAGLGGYRRLTSEAATAPGQAVGGHAFT